MLSRSFSACAALMAVIGLSASAAAADFDWLEAAVNRVNVGSSSTFQAYVSISSTAPDRAAVFYEKDGKTEVRFLYDGRSGLGIQVEFRGKSQVPPIAAIPQLVYPSGLPPKYPPIDRTKLASDPAMRTVAIASELLGSLPVDCTRIVVYDDFVVARFGYAAGDLAQRSELVRATISPLSAISSDGLEVTHMHSSAMMSPTLLGEVLKLAPAGTKKTITSFGHDPHCGLDSYADDKQWHFRITDGRPGTGWSSKPFAQSKEVRERLDRCRTHFGAGHREVLATNWTDQDLESVKALACLDGQTALSAWHRHPRFYSLGK